MVRQTVACAAITPDDQVAVICGVRVHVPSLSNGGTHIKRKAGEKLKPMGARIGRRRYIATDGACSRPREAMSRTCGNLPVLGQLR